MPEATKAHVCPECSSPDVLPYPDEKSSHLPNGNLRLRCQVCGQGFEVEPRKIPRPRPGNPQPGLGQSDSRQSD